MGGDDWYPIQDRTTAAPTKSPTPQPIAETIWIQTEAMLSEYLSNQTISNQTLSNQTISSQTETISKTKLEVATFVSWGGIVLRECEGHCWNDDECGGDLVCFKRS